MKGRKIFGPLLVLAIIAAMMLPIWLSVKLDNPDIALFGIEAVFGGAFFISMIMVIAVFVRAARNVKSETDTAGEHEKEIATVNATAGYSNRMAYAEHEVKSWLRTVRAAPHSDIVKSVILLVWLLGTLFGGMALLFFSNGGENQALLIAGIVSVACFPSTIIIAMIVVVTRQHLSRRVDPNQPPMTGTVVSCTVSSQSSTGSHTRRIGTTTYRMVVAVSGGEKLVAYTRRAYNAGDQVTVQPSRTRGLVTVLDDAQ